LVYKFLRIAFEDLKKGTDPLRIFKKSWARYRKHGFDGMYLRLENEYKNIVKNYERKKGVEEKKVDVYQQWIEQNEYFKIDNLPTYPFFSIIIPVYNTDPKFLTQAIESALNQKYDNFEICIADDCSTSSETLEVLKKYENHEKIKIIYRKENGHISECLNSALSLASGEYVAFLDHDDMLSPYALYKVAKTINYNPNVKLVYSDEDKIDEYNNRYSPYFKSDWNKDLFFSQNYINHLTVIKKEIIDKIGGFRKGYEGSQDYDMILRALEYINDNEIYHVPKILYHWRAIEGSTALNPKAKVYATLSGIKALQDYFRSKKQNVEVLEGLIPNSYKVVYPIPGMSFKELVEPYSETSNINKVTYYNLHYKPMPGKPPLVSIIIPTKDKVEFLKRCIDSVLVKTRYPNYEIIIVNNHSVEKETYEYFNELSEMDNVLILDFNEPFNYSRINNFGVEHSNGEIIVLMNNDIEIISRNWLCEMVQHNLRKEIGVVGAKLYYDNDIIQHAGVILGIGGVAGHSHKYFKREHHGYFGRLKLIQNFSAVTGALMSVRREIYEEVGGLEEKLAVAFNDVDFCLKVMEKGYRNLWTPYVEAYHYESISRGKEDTPEKQRRFQKEVEFMHKKYGKILLSDRYYNPNLTLDHEDFGIGGNLVNE